MTQRKELERTVEELRSKLANAELECKSEVHKRRVVEDKLRGVEVRWPGWRPGVRACGPHARLLGVVRRHRLR